MFPGGMNPRNMGRMMKQMGIKNEEIDASKVIIEKSDGSKLVFDNPSVQLMEMQGTKTYTIVGNPTVESEISKEDIQMVVEQASVSEEVAKKALQDCDGDIAQAILNLKEEE